MSSNNDTHSHPTEKQYWIVFAVLAVLTAVEVAWSYLEIGGARLEGPALVIPLVAMMIIKFLLVGGVFMHLYSDGKALNGKTFTYVFAAGLVIAVLVFAVVAATFEFGI